MLHTPLADGLDLGRRHFLVHLGIAVFSAAEEALQEFAAGGLAGFRIREVDLQPDLLRHIVGGAEDLLRFRREGRHVAAAARTGADQHQAPDQLRGLQRDLLGDEAADREAEDINLLESQRLDEGDGVSTHLLERGRHLPARAGNARIVEQNHLSRRREAFGHRRIPIVDRPGEVLVENERHAARFAEATIGEADAVGLDELRRRSLVAMNHFWTAMNHHGRALFTQPAPRRVRAPGLLSRNRRRSAPWAPRSARSPRQLLRSPYWETPRPTPPHAQAWGCQPKATDRPG